MGVKVILNAEKAVTAASTSGYYLGSVTFIAIDFNVILSSPVLKR